MSMRKRLEKGGDKVLEDVDDFVEDVESEEEDYASKKSKEESGIQRVALRLCQIRAVILPVRRKEKTATIGAL